MSEKRLREMLETFSGEGLTMTAEEAQTAREMLRALVAAARAEGFALAREKAAKAMDASAAEARCIEATARARSDRETMVLAEALDLGMRRMADAIRAMKEG